MRPGVEVSAGKHPASGKPCIRLGVKAADGQTFVLHIDPKPARLVAAALDKLCDELAQLPTTDDTIH